jgi:hypothetical protein
MTYLDVGSGGVEQRVSVTTDVKVQVHFVILVGETEGGAHTCLACLETPMAPVQHVHRRRLIAPRSRGGLTRLGGEREPAQAPRAQQVLSDLPATPDRKITLGSSAEQTTARLHTLTRRVLEPVPELILGEFMRRSCAVLAPGTL